LSIADHKLLADKDMLSLRRSQTAFDVELVTPEEFAALEGLGHFRPMFEGELSSIVAAEWRAVAVRLRVVSLDEAREGGMFGRAFAKDKAWKQALLRRLGCSDGAEEEVEGGGGGGGGGGGAASAAASAAAAGGGVDGVEAVEMAGDEGAEGSGGDADADADVTVALRSSRSGARSVRRRGTGASGVGWWTEPELDLGALAETLVQDETARRSFTETTMRVVFVREGESAEVTSGAASAMGSVDPTAPVISASGRVQRSSRRKASAPASAMVKVRAEETAALVVVHAAADNNAELGGALFYEGRLLRGNEPIGRQGVLAGATLFYQCVAPGSPLDDATMAALESSGNSSASSSSARAAADAAGFAATAFYGH
jgi:hypothetical protein